MIQKRLISKYKDKNPTPLQNLEKLMVDTLQDLDTGSTGLQEELIRLTNCQTELSCVLELTITLLEISEVDGKALEYVKAVMSPFIYDVDGQVGLEVTSQANIVVILNSRVGRMSWSPPSVTSFEPCCPNPKETRLRQRT